MKWLRLTFCALAVIASALVLSARGNASFVQTQRDQIAVYIMVNVTPAPVAYTRPAPSDDRIALRMALRARGSGGFVDVSDASLKRLVAQTQSAVRVQAEVSPNPNATLLYSNQPAVIVNQTAGTTQTLPGCAYTITVDTPSTTSWTLDDGLSNDFVNGSWPGGDLANNTYLQSGLPQPTSTPFVVYSSNNNSWNVKAKSSGMQTYCVTLTLTIPSTIGQGAYTTNAVYTLFY
jgi:hypothetical protein